MINKSAGARKPGSGVGLKCGARRYALLADLNAPAAEEPFALRVLGVVRRKRAGYGSLLAEPPLIPRPLHIGRRQSEFAVVGKQRQAYVDAFIADIPGAALKQARYLAFTQITKRTARDKCRQGRWRRIGVGR